MIRFIRKDYVYNIFFHIVFILILALTMCSSGIFLSQINREKVLYDISTDIRETIWSISPCVIRIDMMN